MLDETVSFVLTAVTNFLTYEATLIGGVPNKVVLLQKELEKIKEILEKADEAEQSETDDRAKAIERRRNIAREAEDVIDDYNIHVIKKRRRNWLENLLPNCSELRAVAKSAAKSIENIIVERESKDEDVLAGSQQQIGANNTNDRRSNTETDHDKVDLVGFADELSKLVKKLTSESNSSNREVISILGMGGSGKTKLAKKIYEDGDVRSYFQKNRAWVQGSRHCQGRDWLLLILNSLRKERKNKKKAIRDDDDDDDHLRQAIFDHLKGKTYLVVLDGMWNNQVWEKTVSEAFPREKGIRILITSRQRIVTWRDDNAAGDHDAEDDDDSGGDKTPLHTSRFLNEKESWQLLSNYVFGGGQVPDDVKAIGKQLANSCKGLPVSIIALGDVLKKLLNHNYTTWSEIYSKKVNSYLTKDDRCLDVITAECYKNFSHPLSSCFLHLGLFPEDYEISVKQLTQLWSAEGFGSKDEADAAEDSVTIARDHLYELINQSFIHVVKKRNDGSMKRCGIPDLLRVLSYKQSRRTLFLEIHSSNSKCYASKARRLSFQDNIYDHISSYSQDRSSSRSLFLFGGGQNMNNFKFDTNHWQIILKSFKYIRVMHIVGLDMKSIPNDIEALVFLKYIRIRTATEQLKIPVSICNIESLETIDIDGRFQNDCLPNQIWRMNQLTHLRVSVPLRLPDPSREKEGQTLANLRTLSTLAVDQRTINFFEGQMARIRKLENLHLAYVGKSKKGVSNSVAAQLLESLERSLQDLKTLKVVDFPKYVPGPNYMFPKKLEKITIIRSYLGPEHLTTLAKLPRLRRLKLRNTKGPSDFRTLGKFENLQEFHMIDLKIETWQLGDDAMKELRWLIINACGQLKNLPEQVSCNLSKLKLLDVSGMSEDFNNMLKESKMKNTGCKIVIDSKVQPNTTGRSFSGIIDGIDDLFLEKTDNHAGNTIVPPNPPVEPLFTPFVVFLTFLFLSVFLLFLHYWLRIHNML